MSNDSEQKEGRRTVVYGKVPGAPPLYEEERQETSLLQLVNVVLRHRWKVLGTSVLLAVVAFAVAVIPAPRYTSDAAFIPQAGTGSGQLSRLSGVASQFGINVPTGEAGQSPQFYADLLTSRHLLEEAVTAEYRPEGSQPVAGDSTAQQTAVQQKGDGGGDNPEMNGRADVELDSAASLLELYEIEAPTRAKAVATAASRLKDAVAVSTNPETGVVRVSVTTPWPAVSKQVVDRLIELVNRFNNRVRQSQASAQAKFVAERLQEVERDLRAAEDSLENFLDRNARWQQSATLRFRHDRLQRRVDLKQQVYTSLASRYEEARIDEVRSTPVVTTITKAQVPVDPDPSRLRLKVILGLMLGGMVGVVWAFGSEFARTAREDHPEDYREFVSLTEDAAEDIRQAGRRVRRLVGSGRGEDKH